MERKLVEVFSYFESSLDLWEVVQDMYGQSLAPPWDRHPPTKLHDQAITFERAFLTSISNVHELKKFQEAHSQAVWKKAMEEELIAL
ncbi:unnamed protein product, partial [Dovyalis caffra]